MRLGRPVVAQPKGANGGTALHRPLVRSRSESDFTVIEYVVSTLEENASARLGIVGFDQRNDDLGARNPGERNTLVKGYRGYGIKI